MSREGEIRKQDIESLLLQNDKARIDAIEHSNAKKLNELVDDFDEIAKENALIDEARALNKKLHRKKPDGKVN